MDGRIIPQIIGLISSEAYEAQRISYILASSLRDFITNDKIKDMDKETAFTTPSFYSFITALLVIEELEDSVKTYPIEDMDYINYLEFLVEYARKLLNDPAIVERIKWYLKIPDTENLARKLLAFI